MKNGIFLGMGVVVLAAVVAFAMTQNGRQDDGVTPEEPTPVADNGAAPMDLAPVDEPIVDVPVEEPPTIVEHVLEEGEEWPGLGVNEKTMNPDGTMTIKTTLKTRDLETGEVKLVPVTVTAKPTIKRLPIVKKGDRRAQAEAEGAEQDTAGPPIPQDDDGR
jgi:hypothetical protein